MNGLTIQIKYLSSQNLIFKKIKNIIIKKNKNNKIIKKHKNVVWIHKVRRSKKTKK